MSDKTFRIYHGIECPKCGCQHVPVYKTRSAMGKEIIRMRECRNCGKKFMTKEAKL